MLGFRVLLSWNDERQQGSRVQIPRKAVAVIRPSFRLTTTGKFLGRCLQQAHADDKPEYVLVSHRSYERDVHLCGHRSMNGMQAARALHSFMTAAEDAGGFFSAAWRVSPQSRYSRFGEMTRGGL